MALREITANIKSVPNLKYDYPLQEFEAEESPLEAISQTIEPLLVSMDKLISIAADGFKKLDNRMYQMVLTQARTNMLLSAQAKEDDAEKSRLAAEKADQGTDGSFSKPIKPEDKKGIDFLDLLGLGALGLAGFAAAMKASILEMVEKYTEQLVAFVKRMTKITKALFKISVVTKVADAIKDFKAAISGGVEKVAGFFKRFTDLIKSGVMNVLRIVFPGIDIVKIGLGKMMGVLGSLVSGLKYLFTPLFLIMGAYETVTGALEEINNLSADASMIEKIGAGLLGAIKGLYSFIVEGVLNLVRDLVSWVTDKLGFGDMAKSIKSLDFSFDVVVETIKNGFKNIVGMLLAGAINFLPESAFGYPVKKKAFEMLPDSIKEFANLSFEGGEVRSTFKGYDDAKKTVANNDVEKIKVRTEKVLTKSEQGDTKETKSEKLSINKKLTEMESSNKISASEADSIRKSLNLESLRLESRASESSSSDNMTLSELSDVKQLNLKSLEVTDRALQREQMSVVTDQQKEMQSSGAASTIAPSYVDASTKNNTNVSNSIFSGTSDFETQNPSDGLMYGYKGALIPR